MSMMMMAKATDKNGKAKPSRLQFSFLLSYGVSL
jgi:hypothetical protein